MRINQYSTTGKRDENQDRIFAKIPDNREYYALGIIDGHGDESGGKFASLIIEILTDIFDQTESIFLKAFNSPNHQQELEKITHTMVKYTTQILKENHYTLAYESGSTFLLLLLYKNKSIPHATFINLGDSLAVAYNKNNTPVFQTKPHKPDRTTERNMIEKKGGKITKSKSGTYRIDDLAMSRALGDLDNSYISSIPEIHHKNIKNESIKTIILASDGLWDVVTEQEAITHLKNIKKTNDTNLSKELADLALKNDSSDNISIVTIEL